MTYTDEDRQEGRYEQINPTDKNDNLKLFLLLLAVFSLVIFYINLV